MRADHLKESIDFAIRNAEELSSLTREEYIVVVQGRAAHPIRRAYFNRHRSAYYGARIVRQGIKNF